MKSVPHALPWKRALWLSLLWAVGLPLTLRADPTPEEQYWLELLNQARMDPAGELTRLTNYATPTTFGSPASNDADIAAAINFFGVSASDLAAQWSALVAAPPLAWNNSLANSAVTYSQVMVNQDQQAHNLDGLDLQQRTANGGYGANYLDLGENLYAASKSVTYGNAGFLIDWGDSDSNPNNGYGNGIQAGVAHRQISFDPAFKEIGIGLVTSGIPNSNVNAVGPYVVTQHLGNQFRLVGTTYVSDAILTGVMYEDTVIQNNFYTPGEGIGGAPILVFDRLTNHLLFSGTTNSVGGFNIALPGVIDGEELRIVAPNSGLPDQFETISAHTTDPSVYGQPVTFYDNIYAGFQEVPEPGSLLVATLSGLIFTCSRRRFCFDKRA